jgi:hypothetical protein
VFVKFFGNERTPLRLRPGHRLFFYKSKARKEIVGEADIVKVESMPVSSVISVYGDKLFLNESEFKEYVGLRTDRTMLVVELTDAKPYSSPLNLGKSVTMTGRYMTREMYAILRGKSSAGNM